MIDLSNVQRLLVTGSRDWPAPRLLLANLRRFYRPHIIMVVGDARGVDTRSAKIWRGQGGEVEVHAADWARFGKRAGVLRNEEMVRSINPDHGMTMAFINNCSRGATHCAGFSEEWAIPTFIWRIYAPQPDYTDGPSGSDEHPEAWDCHDQPIGL